MWTKASDNSTEAFFHSAAPELKINKYQGQENKEQPLSRIGVMFLNIIMQAIVNPYKPEASKGNVM